MDFEEKRQQLLKEAYQLSEDDKFSDNYKRNFFELVEDIILYLLQTQDVFFGQFMLRVQRKINTTLTAPIATIPKRDRFEMYFNPFLFLDCNRKEMAALFKHEIYHIMNSHLKEKEN